MGTGSGRQSRARPRASDQHVRHNVIRNTEDVQVISSGRRGGQRAPQGTPSEAGPSLTVGLPHPSPGWVSCSGLMAEGSQQQASLGLAWVGDASEQRSAGRVLMDLKGSGPACD